MELNNSRSDQWYDFEKMEAKKKHEKLVTKAVTWSILGALIAVFVLNIIILPLTGGCARVEHISEYTGENPWITYSSEHGLLLSAHRAGGTLEPEETMAAFKQCLEGADRDGYTVDLLEFDLHLTKDGELVLMHDDTIDRTSNGKGKVCDFTLAELQTYNFGYNFQTEDGEYKYRKEGADLTNVRILTLEDVLDYVENVARTNHDMNYVIEIKDGNDVGRRAMDKLYEIMVEYDIIDRTVFGTFNGEISKYVDECNANGTFEHKVVRSAGIMEVLNFYFAFLWGRDLNEEKLGYSVLQIPMGLENFYDFATVEFMDYAHANNIAVQYWTINDPDDVICLAQNGADCIMTDDPKMAYNAMHK